jgi:hypothetical protein
MAPPTPAPAPAAAAAPVGWAAAPAATPGTAGTAGAGARPTGIVVAAILAAINGILLVLGALLVMVGSSFVGGAIGSDANGSGALGGAVAGIGFVFGIIVLLIALCFLAVAIGNWRGRSWSWVLGLIVWIITLVLGVLGLSSNANLFSIVLEVAFPAIALFFLWQADSKRWLGRA